VGETRSIFVQPNHGAPIRSDEGSDLKKMAEDVGLIPVPAMKGEGSPEAGLSSASIGFQVDDIQLIHRFRM
jgi:hypothetical protein